MVHLPVSPANLSSAESSQPHGADTVATPDSPPSHSANALEDVLVEQGTPPRPNSETATGSGGSPGELEKELDKDAYKGADKETE